MRGVGAAVTRDGAHPYCARVAAPGCGARAHEFLAIDGDVRLGLLTRASVLAWLGGALVVVDATKRFAGHGAADAGSNLSR